VCHGLDACFIIGPLASPRNARLSDQGTGKDREEKPRNVGRIMRFVSGPPERLDYN
jgi:hypothetical protein